MKDLTDFFSGVGMRVFAVVLLAISLALFVAPAALACRRIFLTGDYPTIQAEYVDWARWIWVLLLVIVAGKSLDDC